MVGGNGRDRFADDNGSVTKAETGSDTFRSMEIGLLTSPGEVVDLRREYLAGLPAPIDGMWETFVDRADHWAFPHDGEEVGYCCADDQHRLLQFHVTDRYAHLASGVFARVLDEVGVHKAMVSTFEPWLEWCLDHHREVRVHTLLYHHHGRTSVSDRASERSLDPVRGDEREMIEAFVRRSFPESHGDWLAGYLDRLVSRGELFVLRDQDAVLGTGELRVSDTQPPYADLGVIVAPDQRGRGHAPFILTTLRDRCDRAGLIPICSTTIDNAAARRAIEKAGFVARHRLLEVQF